jgi:hypothetical protein
MSESDKKRKSPKLIGILTLFVIPLAGVIATIFFPEIRCSIGLFADTCTASQQQVELITQSDTGEALAGVKVQVIAKGAPENQYTDSNGYAKVQISSKGDVRVNLSISGYPVQDFNINLANDQNTVRIIRFTKSGKPEVSSVPTISSVVSSPTPSPTPTTTQSTVTPYEDDRVRATAIGASFDQSKIANASLIIENKSSNDLLLASEARRVRMISSSGSTTECGLDGLAAILNLPSTPDPLTFSRLKAKSKTTVSVSNCQRLDASKTDSVSVNIPLILLENDKPTKFTINLSGIPIRK